MEIKEFLDEVIARKNRMIIDDFFLFIQNDRGLMKDYLYLVEEKGLQNVNKQIALGIEEEYKLISFGKNDEPESKLITTYSLLKKPE